MTKGQCVRFCVNGFLQETSEFFRDKEECRVPEVMVHTQSAWQSVAVDSLPSRLRELLKTGV
jgi:hypothetical protein